MNYEIAKLAQRLKLTTEQLKNPKVQHLLAQFLEDEKVFLSEPPLQMPKKRGAVHGATYATYIDTLKER